MAKSKTKPSKGSGGKARGQGTKKPAPVATKSAEAPGVEARRAYAKLVARYWADTGFRKEIEQDPARALAPYGMAPSQGKARVVVLKKNEMVLAIPEITGKLTPDQVVLEANCVGSAGSIACAFTFGGCAGSFGSLFCFGCSDVCISDEPDEPKEPDDEGDDEGEGEGDEGGDDDGGGKGRIRPR